MRDVISANLRRIEDRIAAALAKARPARNPVTLVAVTKSVELEEIDTLRELGLTHFGENRLQPARPKIEANRSGVVWHMIGNLQRRKAKDVVGLFDCVDAVDRIELADELHARAEAKGIVLPVLLEVNVSGEESKHGFAPDHLESALAHVRSLAALRVEGLMTMAPFYEDPEKTRPVFARLRGLADTYGLPRVSMGMSNDYDVAIEEGATEVRIGTALFEGI